MEIRRVLDTKKTLKKKYLLNKGTGLQLEQSTAGNYCSTYKPFFTIWFSNHGLYSHKNISI